MSGPYYGAGTIRAPLHSTQFLKALEKVVTLHWHGVGAFLPSCLSPPINFWAWPHSSTQGYLLSSCPACPASAFHPFSCLSPSPASRMCLMVSHCPCSPLVYHHSTYQLLYRSTPRCLTPLRHVTHFHFHLTKGFARTYFRDPSSSLVSSSCDALDYASVRCCRFPVIRYLWIYCITILRSVPS